MVLIYTWSWIL